jgi:D-ribose pyranase
VDRKKGLAYVEGPVSFLPVIRTGILNPQILSLLSRVRHTNALVIADRGFPFWPQIETVDISLVDDLPTVLQTLAAVRGNCNFTQACMAREFRKNNSGATVAAFAKGLAGIPTTFEPHAQFKKRVPAAIGLIRTADTIQYANLILISG